MKTLFNTCTSTTNIINTAFDSNFKYLPSGPPRLFTIADVLLVDDDVFVQQEEGVVLMGCVAGAGDDRDRLAPRRVVARWLSALRLWRRSEKQFISKRQKEAVSGDADDHHHRESSAQIRCSMNGFNGGDSLNSVSHNHGPCEQETSFNVGIGCCMLYLLAASRNELDKMVELRKQMEMLLQSAKEELERRGNTVSKMSEPKDIVALSYADGPEGPDSNILLSPHILAASESSITMASEEYLKCSVPKPEESTEGMDRLEAEFAAEFEQLQLHLDADLNHPEQKIKKWQVTVGDTAASRSCNVSSGEVIAPDEESYDEVQHYGVSPYELERRLHELLATRQDEQIRELEAALKCASRKLHENEMEISWWKDTAHLIMQQMQEPSRRNFEHESVAHPLLR